MFFQTKLNLQDKRLPFDFCNVYKIVVPSLAVTLINKKLKFRETNKRPQM